jgi:acetyltransferase-like isoleucine patch superfamily enzyme
MFGINSLSDLRSDEWSPRAIRVKTHRRIKGAIKAKLSRAERIGKGCKIDGRVILIFRGKAVIGDGFRASGRRAAVYIKVEKGGSLSVGNKLGMNGGTMIEVFHEVRIGNNLKMGPYASIIDDSRHETEPGVVRYKGPIIIGNNVWLSQNAIVLPGVSIGDGSVIGANSVVTHDIPPYSLAVGSPARVVKKLEVPDGWVRG